MVLHHSEQGWTGAVAFEQILDADPETLAAVAGYVPAFRFILEDISHESDEALKARAITALARLALFCLRHAREPGELVARLRGWADLVHEVRKAPGGAAALVRIMRYILEVNEPAQPEEIVARLAADRAPPHRAHARRRPRRLSPRRRPRAAAASCKPPPPALVASTRRTSARTCSRQAVAPPPAALLPVATRDPAQRSVDLLSSRLVHQPRASGTCSKRGRNSGRRACCRCISRNTVG